MNILSGNTERQAEWKYCQTVISEQIDMWRERSGNHSTNTERVCVCVCENAASSRRVTVAKPPPTQFSRSIELSIWNINNFFSYGNVFLNKTHRNKVLHPDHLDWQDYKTLSHVSHVWVSLLCLKSQSHLLALPRTCAWLGSAPEIFISMTT